MKITNKFKKVPGLYDALSNLDVHFNDVDYASFDPTAWNDDLSVYVEDVLTEWNG